MRLVVFSGSSRGKKSNTDILLAAFLGGFTEEAGNTYELFHLLSRDGERHLAAFATANAALIAFPLYIDAMPALVTEFAQALSPLCERSGNPRLLFLVQSGFPEAFHSRPIGRWAEKLARRLGSPHVGTIVKGGVEGIQSRPPRAYRRLLEQLRALGRTFGATGQLSPQALERLARPERLGFAGRLMCRAVLPLVNRRWDTQLRANDVLASRDDTPFYARPARAPERASLRRG